MAKMKALYRKVVNEPSIIPSNEYFIDEFQVPQHLNSHDVVVEIAACGLSHINGKILGEIFKKGQCIQYPAGWEIAGIVHQVGSQVATVKKNDKIVGMLPLDSECTGLCRMSVINEYNIVKVPDGVSLVDAAALVGDGLKMYTALHYQVHLAAGDTVLVIGAGSSWGYLTCQLAALWGAKVIGTVRNSEEKQALQKLDPGIDYVMEVNNKSNLMVSSVIEQTGGLGADIVIDTVGALDVKEANATKKNNITQHHTAIHDIILCLSPGGRWITSHDSLQLDPPHSQMLFMKGCSVSFLFEHIWTLSSSQTGRYSHILNEVMKKCQTGALKSWITKTVSLDYAMDNINDLQKEHSGKIVVSMSAHTNK